MAKKSSIHRSVFQTWELVPCTNAPFLSKEIAWLGCMSCAMLRWLCLWNDPGFSGSDCWNPSGFLRNGVSRHPGLPQVHQRLAKRPWGLSKVLVPTIGRHWLRWGFFMIFFYQSRFLNSKDHIMFAANIFEKNTRPNPRWVHEPLNKSLVGFYLKYNIYIHTYYQILSLTRLNHNCPYSGL